MKPRFEDVTGRYMHLEMLGRPHRLYVEEAGRGIPLLCLHTAGSDGRQYRGVMNDPRVTANYRVIAFDMPWHGKSSPPAGFQDEEYKLTSRDYVQMILEVMAALELDHPVVMGCSIGGRIALHLALDHPEKFRAIIGLQAGAHAEPYYDLNFLHRPDVHGGEMSRSDDLRPDRPERARRRPLRDDLALQAGRPRRVQGRSVLLHPRRRRARPRGEDRHVKCPLFLLTGEYDYSCTPEDTLAIARAVKGAEATIMKGMGHFPMSEDPKGFLEYLLPVLERIRTAEKRSAA